ncbi:exonuclease SbcCD subunit D [Nocardia sp. NBC_00565]|uniref:metallophosphoesterase family protein n=1 Tax=Nocardia sp. NBC_00565 TaxID=2975993 RepID=UPI002E81C328|nr:exonuclease SbcCD subunit D [Nocardia sp. NBC_00565]WUC02010.1 exonuclease SbcCD subunit D [Nocardia sp. NBC_00565]
MRVLHTSDWHLGKILYKHSRAEDHDIVLAEIIDVARKREPHLIVHTGDLFDHARPAYPDLRKAITALKELAAVAPVVVVRGNHDSPQLFQLFSETLAPDSRIYFIDSPRDPKDGGVLYFPGPDNTVLRLGVLPFIPASHHIDGFDDPDRWHSAYAQAVGKMERDLAEELLRDFDDSRDIAMFAAHLHIGGANLARSERPAHTSDYYATNPDDLPSVAYAAFGHIHKPQPLPNTNVTGRYAGSPIPLDFGECGERKSVVMVELHPGQPAQVDLVGLSGGRPLRRFEGTLEQLRVEAPSIGRELCLITIHTPTHEPTLSEQVRALLPRATVLDVYEDCADQKLEILTQDTVTDDAEPDLRELFRDYLTVRGSSTVPAEHLHSKFGQILTSLEEERPLVLPEEDLLTDPPDIDTEFSTGRDER